MHYEMAGVHMDLDSGNTDWPEGTTSTGEGNTDSSSPAPPKTPSAAKRYAM